MRFSDSRAESITVDNGSEFSGRALEAWAMSNEVQLCFIRPGLVFYEERPYYITNGILHDTSSTLNLPQT